MTPSHPIRVVCDDGLAPRFSAVAARGQLIVYEFAPGASFQGELGGALERAESGGAMRVLEAFFMQRDAETDELIVVDLRGDGAGGLIGPLLDFRLDRDARRRATERALAGGVPGVSGDALREFGNGGWHRVPRSPPCCSSTSGRRRWRAPSRGRVGDAS